MIQAAFAKHLHQLGHGVYGAAGADIFIEDLPATPVDAIGIWVKTAPPGDYSPGRLTGLQIVVRRTPDPGRARTGYEAARAILDDLHGLRHITLDDGGPDEVQVTWVRADGDEPTNIGDDLNGLPRWGLRLLTQTRAVTAHTIL